MERLREVVQAWKNEKRTWKYEPDHTEPRKLVYSATPVLRLSGDRVKASYDRGVALSGTGKCRPSRQSHTTG